MTKIGIAHIFASYNNIHITVTDVTGAETLAK
ncbi:MAG: 30S ribosomal protein S11, partial [Thermoplasmata archaeon]